MSKSTGNEVITLQFGNFSNFIGAQWWNSQEAGFIYDSEVVSDINHDVLFREGQNHRGDITFTPRMLLVDLKDSVSMLNNDLYNDVYDETKILQAVETWPQNKIEKLEVLRVDHEDRRDESHKMQANEEEEPNNQRPDLWSDYLQTRYHPRSINLIDEYQHDNFAQPFDCYLQGVEIWKSESLSEEWTDRLRGYVEECDNMQGFQIISDATDGFSGICSSALQYIKDEYSSKCCLVFPVMSPRTPWSDYRLRNVNSVLFCSELNEFADIYSPLSLAANCWDKQESFTNFPFVHYDESSKHHSSSILSLLLDTLSLTYRQRGNTGMRLNDLCAFLTPVGRKVVSSSVQVPWPMKHGQSLLECLELWDGPLSVSLTPYSNLDGLSIQNVNMRGYEKQKLFPKDINMKDRHSNPAYTCSSVTEMLQYFLSCDAPRSLHRVFTSNQAIKTSHFPHIFDKNVSGHGCIQEAPLDQPMKTVEQIPVLSGLHCCKSTSTTMSSLYEQAQNINVKAISSLLALDRTDYSEALEAVISMSENYIESDLV